MKSLLTRKFFDFDHYTGIDIMVKIALPSVIIVGAVIIFVVYHFFK